MIRLNGSIGRAGAMVCAALGFLGCAEQVDAPGEQVAKDSDGLYLALQDLPWTPPTVFVCYDPTDGANGTLIGEAQNVLRDSWTRAANLQFSGRSPFNFRPQPQWAACDYSASVFNGVSMIAVHFCDGNSNSPHCPGTSYDNGVVAPNAFRGETDVQGMVLPVATSPVSPPVYHAGITNVSLIADDGDPYHTRFHHEVMHEFGHALGFEHEQDRPENFKANGSTVYCSDTAVYTPGGVEETPSFDLDSIMDYCARDPLTNGFVRFLSNGDVYGVRRQYGRGLHGFMIKSDANSSLAVTAASVTDGANLTLASGCTVSNPKCTWSNQRGMLVSDQDPRYAIRVSTAAEGTALTLSSTCTPATSNCNWIYKGGKFISKSNTVLSIAPSGGAKSGAKLVTHNCQASDPCSWTLPNVMFTSDRNGTMALNAHGGASLFAPIAVSDACVTLNASCTFTYNKGMLVSDGDTRYAINAYGGAHEGGPVELDFCTADNPSCTWTWQDGALISDEHGLGTFPIGVPTGAQPGSITSLSAVCNARDPDCVFLGIAGK